MRKIKISLLALAMILTQFVKADEGMWLPFLLGRNYEDMKKHGLRLSQEEIYSINNSSLKDAIISFGGYCTGEVISNQGLILTNHHCGYGSIAGASTEENNYLDNGFWAKSKDQEIAIPGLTATFIIRIQDVSETINRELTAGMTVAERDAKIKEVSDILIKDATNGTEYKAFVRDFFEGNEFYLFVQETYNDVRLVGTPPQSAGKFGGDTDNWEWPRHTADFSMFRIYSGADNKPAAFSADNKPYKPKHHLPISLKGVEEGDYAMILGFPGSTDRYLSSYGIEQTVNNEYPKRVEIRGVKLEIMKSYMDQDVNVRLEYSSKYAQVANYWKNFRGMNEQVKANKVIAKKQSLENKFAKFASKNAEYANVLSDMEKAYAAKQDYLYIGAYQSEMLYSIDVMLAAFRYKFWMDAMEAGQTERANAMAVRFGETVMKFLDSKNIALELKTVHQLLEMYISDVPADQQGPFIKKLGSKGHKGLDKFDALIKKKSIFINAERFEKFMKNPTAKVLQKDPLYMLVKDMNDAYTKVQEKPELVDAAESLEHAKRLFVKGLREMQPEKQFYPNANSTLRLTYGNVLPYSPRNGVMYDYTTTYEGILEKEDPDNFEFNVDPIMKTKMLAKDFGQYADKNGSLTINFLSNNDITGGNSGSPVLNADGHLIGAAFDGNYEALSGDIFFEPNIQRTINCDIRYILWLVDKCYGAKNLVDEMDLVK
jgi:hypothetical protein